MKEATGELNMTVVTVVAIAAVAAFFYAFIWPSIKTNILNSTKCASATCPNTCTAGSTCTCTYINDSGTSENVTCKIQND
jgi:hypothetical protein